MNILSSVVLLITENVCFSHRLGCRTPDIPKHDKILPLDLSNEIRIFLYDS
jgi:hypothetical protein